MRVLHSSASDLLHLRPANKGTVHKESDNML
jgi:hypothetical protein